MQDEDVLRDHISACEHKHTYTTEASRSTNNQSLCRHLLEYLKSDETKAHHLLMSVPSCIDNIFDNLQSKDSSTYVDIRSRLLKLFRSSNLSSDGKPLNAWSHEVNKSTNKKKNSEKPNPTRPGKSEFLKGNHCSYCKEHNHSYKGHPHGFCNRLKSACDNCASSAPSAALSRDVFPYRANLTINEQSDHHVALITCSLPHPVATIASGSAFRTVNDNTYAV